MGYVGRHFSLSHERGSEFSATTTACWLAECRCLNELTIVAALSNGARGWYSISIAISANAMACPSRSVQGWEVLLLSPGHLIVVILSMH